jgi:chromate transporter
MHRVFVDERAGSMTDRFQRMLAFCMLLPGPEAQQLATYVGWRLRGWAGALIAGWMFVLPGARSCWRFAALRELRHVSRSWLPRSTASNARSSRWWRKRCSKSASAR